MHFSCNFQIRTRSVNSEWNKRFHKIFLSSDYSCCCFFYTSQFACDNGKFNYIRLAKIVVPVNCSNSKYVTKISSVFRQFHQGTTTVTILLNDKSAKKKNAKKSGKQNIEKYRVYLIWAEHTSVTMQCNKNNKIRQQTCYRRRMTSAIYGARMLEWMYATAIQHECTPWSGT